MAVCVILLFLSPMQMGGFNELDDGFSSNEEQ